MSSLLSCITNRNTYLNIIKKIFFITYDCYCVVQEITKEDPHQLQLARLEWELKQRKELASLCDKKKLEKEMVIADIKKKKTKLKNLAPMLKEILAVS